MRIGDASIDQYGPYTYLSDYPVCSKPKCKNMKIVLCLIFVCVVFLLLKDLHEQYLKLKIYKKSLYNFVIQYF